MVVGGRRWLAVVVVVVAAALSPAAGPAKRKGETIVNIIRRTRFFNTCFIRSDIVRFGTTPADR